jgi:DNA invertase Pin-like site-specific DNA recombinase
MKCLIYARVSPKGSTWASSESTIDMQIQHCKDFVSASGGEVHSIVKDEFFTAKDTRRPGLKGILAELEAGTAEWDSLIVYRLDRLTRSLRDGGRDLRRAARERQGLRLGLRTPGLLHASRRAMLWIIHVFAQFEREQLGERTKDKMVQIAREGGYAPGTTPFGYMRKAKHDNALAIDPAKAAIVKDIFESYAAGVQSIEIWKRYSRHISKNQMLAMLRNRVYLGKIVYDGQEYPGKHDSIISEELFGKVQARLPNKARNTRPPRRSTPIYSRGW